MLFAFLCLLITMSSAQTETEQVAGNADAQINDVAPCWPWWCFPATSNIGEGADGEGCKMWIAHALARGCSPYGGFRPWETYLRPVMYPVGPVMGPGMPIQGPPPAPAAKAKQRPVQDGDVMGTDVEKPDTEAPEQDTERLPVVNGNLRVVEGLKLEKAVIQEPEQIAPVAVAPVEEKETPEKKLRHPSPHTQKVLKAIQVNAEWNSTGMWLGLSSLFLVLGALAGYGIMNWLQKRQAMSCLAGYGWDIPLTSRTDDL